MMVKRVRLCTCFSPLSDWRLYIGHSVRADDAGCVGKHTHEAERAAVAVQCEEGRKDEMRLLVLLLRLAVV